MKRQKRKQLLTSADAIEEKKQHISPCSDCPWARKSLPGWLGPHTTWEWLNIAHGDGRMECHTRTIMGEPAQCAGASIFRANICKLTRGPNLRLPADKVKVFAWDDEFATHHEGRPVTKQEAANEKMKDLFSRI